MWLIRLYLLQLSSYFPKDSSKQSYSFSSKDGSRTRATSRLNPLKLNRLKPTDQANQSPAIWLAAEAQPAKAPPKRVKCWRMTHSAPSTYLASKTYWIFELKPRNYLNGQKPTNLYYTHIYTYNLYLGRRSRYQALSLVILYN